MICTKFSYKTLHSIRQIHASQVCEDAVEDELEEEHGGALARLVEVVERPVGGLVDEDGDRRAAVAAGTLHYAGSSMPGGCKYLSQDSRYLPLHE